MRGKGIGHMQGVGQGGGRGEGWVITWGSKGVWLARDRHDETDRVEGQGRGQKKAQGGEEGGKAGDNGGRGRCEQGR